MAERWTHLCGVEGNVLTFGLLLLLPALFLFLFLIAWGVQGRGGTVARSGGAVGRAGWGVLGAAGTVGWGGWGIFRT